MRLNDESRVRLTVPVRLTSDPTGSTVALKVDAAWHACTWQGDPVESGDVWTQEARTTEYFSGPTASPAGDVVLALGLHQTEVRVTLAGGDAPVAYSGAVEVKVT